MVKATCDKSTEILTVETSGEPDDIEKEILGILLYACKNVSRMGYARMLALMELYDEDPEELDAKLLFNDYS